MSDTDADPLWTPSSPSTTQAALLRQHINRTYSLDVQSYSDLWTWTCEHRSTFWSEVWDWEGVLGEKGDAPYVDEGKRPRDNPFWFEGAQLNWAENQLRQAKSRPDDIAIIQVSEACPQYSPPERRVTQRELLHLVGRAQRSLRAAGVGRGDRVAFWGGTCLEAAVLLLATSSLGGIFSSAAADFGVDGVAERLAQIRPKVLVVTNGVVYAGVARPMLKLLPTLMEGLAHPPQTVVVVSHLPDELAPTPSELEGTVRRWDEWLDEGRGRTSGEGSLSFERMGFNEPIWILFSSGTTGKPKAIVHRQGGMLLDSLREHHLQGNIGPGDVYLYYTTPGWMMFQYLISGLATGATLVLYEGSPLKDPSSLWRLVDDLNITVFGTSAKYLEQISLHYPDVAQNHSLASLRQILSTGSPLPPQLFDFVYDRVKRDVLLGSVTGGTDICSVFAGRCTELPVYKGEIQCRMLGFALDTASPDPHTPGELIVREAFPIQPLGFWPLPGYGFPEADVAQAQERFLESYFKDDQGNWYHGDYIQITPSRSGNAGGVLMLGRSDGVLNPGGIRFGPTDIYSVLDSPVFHELGMRETLVVGLLVQGGADEKVVLFVKMREGKELDDALIKKIKTEIRVKRSARHVPAEILQASGIPVTLTGKKVEVPIRKVINGASITSINPATLRNPECLEEYARLGDVLRAKETH